MSATSDKNNDETKVVDELENNLFELLVEIRAGERRAEKIKMAIRALKPDFVDLDVMEVISRPLSEQKDGETYLSGRNV